MGVLRTGLRPAFGMFVIAHGLAHAALPLRGSMDPARVPWDFMPVILYSVAVIGFTIAGLGVFNIRPFAAAMRPAPPWRGRCCEAGDRRPTNTSSPCPGTRASAIAPSNCNTP